MKFPASILLFLFTGFIYLNAQSQNVSINVLTQNSGIVQKGKTIFFEVTINNTSSSSNVGVYKLKAQVSVPDSIISIQKSGHNLPTGWEIISYTNSAITISNGKDIIASNDSRTLLIAIKGEKTGGPKALTGQLTFSNGEAPGTAPGALTDDNPADNYSKSTCKVIK